MGADHARIVARDLKCATLQVVCDMKETRARSVADACDAVDVTSDPAGTISRQDVDAVIIATPDSTHASLCLACIAESKPVLCEKPLSRSSTDCLEVMEAEHRAGRQLVQVGFMRRFDRAYREMKASLDSGALGRPLIMHNFHRNVETPGADFTAAMAITNSAPHEFDVARHVLGTEYRDVSAFRPERSDALVPPVIMVLGTEDDQLVTIEINNNAAYGYDIRAELVGETGSISMNDVAYTRTDAGLSSTTGYDTDWRNRFANAYVSQGRDFLDFVETGNFSLVAANCWDGYAAAIVAEAGARALDSGSRCAIRMIGKPEVCE